LRDAFDAQLAANIQSSSVFERFTVNGVCVLMRPGREATKHGRKMPMEDINEAALNALLLAEWRKIPGCEDVGEVAVYEVKPPRLGVNWGLGWSDTTTDACRNTLITMAAPLQQKYRLVPEGTR
jgi:hypothetical protein